MLQYLAIKNTAVYCKNCRVLWNAICTAVEVLLKVLQCTNSWDASGAAL